jgi:hypothetical protein
MLPAQCLPGDPGLSRQDQLITRANWADNAKKIRQKMSDRKIKTFKIPVFIFLSDIFLSDLFA